MPRRTKITAGSRIQTRIDALAAISASSAGPVRHFLTPEHKAAAELCMTWMQEAGLVTSLDAAGTIVGCLQSGAETAPTLLIGAHINTLDNSGKFAGATGLLVALAAIEELRRGRHKLPYAIEVLGFGNMEATRFDVPMLGSRALAGALPQSAIDVCDADGVSLADALRAFGSDPEGLGRLPRDPASVLGYIEVAIEQGPVLERENLPIGVVTAISGASRFRVVVTGAAGHAGTVPMALRRDALAGAAEIVLAIEALARDMPGLLATVGALSPRPGRINIVAGEVELTCDVRSPVDRARRAAVRQIDRVLKEIARRRRLDVTTADLFEVKAASCDHRLISHFSAAVERAGLSAYGMPSGAGHDGLSMSRLCPIGMLFVRSRVHSLPHGQEIVSGEDIDIAIRVLVDVLRNLSPSGRSLA